MPSVRLSASSTAAGLSLEKAWIDSDRVDFDGCAVWSPVTPSIYQFFQASINFDIDTSSVNEILKIVLV